MTLCQVYNPALASYGDAVGTRLADVIPQTIWDSLTERGLIERGREYAGEGTCAATSAGYEYLIGTTHALAAFALARLDGAR